MEGALLFLRMHEVLAIHARGIEEFGGLPGVRDAGALEAALTAAENRTYYEQATLITCAATYAYHLTQAHAFNDEIVTLFLAIAAGQIARQDVERWFSQRVVKAESSA